MPASGGEITYVAWNKKVQHILASCSTNGSCVVWDLKRQKPVISFKDPNRYVANQPPRTLLGSGFYSWAPPLADAALPYPRI